MNRSPCPWAWSERTANLMLVAIPALAAGSGGLADSVAGGLLRPPAAGRDGDVVPIAQLAEPPAGEPKFPGERIEGRGPGAVAKPSAGEGDRRHLERLHRGI